MKKYLPFILIGLVLLADQALKFYIKTNYTLGEEHHLFPGSERALLHFTENEGIAFGLKLDWVWGKLFLTVFRILAASLIFYYLLRLRRQRAHEGLIISVAFIFAGAVGNIIDSIFYGVLFSQSTYFQVAQFLPEDGGYERLLYGKVVDMFYFPLFDGHYPEWFPFVGGDYFLFFRPVFNIADASITIGVLLILLFYRKHLRGF